MTNRILNIDGLEFRSVGNGDRYQASIGAIGRKLGAQKLGYNVTVLPPGKRAFPRHHHRVNEEMFFILEGEGTLRLGDSEHAIRRGDVIACPPGGREDSHQIVNTSNAELRYLAVSTQLSPEIVGYPDTGKLGILAEFPGADGKPETTRLLYADGTPQADYYAGE